MLQMLTSRLLQLTLSNSQMSFLRRSQVWLRLFLGILSVQFGKEYAFYG